jgi:predicted methyltransferase
MKLRLTAAAAVVALIAAPAVAQAPVIAGAISDSGRPAKDIQLDGQRLPAEMLAFSKVKPGETVVDVWPGGGYWTRLFSDVVGPKGKVWAYVPAEIAGFKSDPVGLAKAKLLKPGGSYIVVDHAAEAGSGLSHTEDLHRIDPAAVRAEVEKAGFVFDGETKVLANPDDPKTAKIIDPAIKGKTDRFALRFRKPKP